MLFKDVHILKFDYLQIYPNNNIELGAIRGCVCWLIMTQGKPHYNAKVWKMRRRCAINLDIYEVRYENALITPTYGQCGENLDSPTRATVDCLFPPREVVKKQASPLMESNW